MVHLHLPHLGVGGGSHGYHHGHGRREGGGPAPPYTPPPKGWMAIRVGQEGEEQQRFVVPVVYLNHPLFVGLLKEAEEEYGFEQKGAITIPCHVEHFRRVQGIIDRDSGSAAGYHHHGGGAGAGAGGGHHHHNHHFHLCFKA